MRFKYLKASILLSILLSVFIIPTSIASNYESTNNFQAQYSVLNHKLYVSIPPSLYNHYSNLSHAVNDDSYYARLVTPQVVEPIAENIEKVTNNLPYRDEQFANAVLGLVHQIPYNITDPKYPIETLVDNSGDCVELSLLAASIMKAGGLDVVLIHYTGINPGHMNVGVYLPYTPIYHTFLLAPTSFEYCNKTYWTAEATPEDNWKIGDQSGSIANSNPVIIPLDNTEMSSPAKVSSSLDSIPLPSNITMNLSQRALIEQENTRSLTLSGSIQPNFSNQVITIYLGHGFSYNYFTTVTDGAGNYTFTWNFTSQGTYAITTSWSGTSNYAGADSETLAVFIGPESFIQFQTNDYKYIYGQASIASYEVRPFLGISDFLSILLGTNLTLSYDFAILQTGQAPSNVQTKTVIVPASERTIRTANRQTKTVEIPEITVIVPTFVPRGLEPLRLPDDFNQAINSQFCFILQNNAGSNYSLNIKGLNDYDLSKIEQDNGNKIAFLNATEDLEESTWYKVTAIITINEITTNLQNADGTLIQSKTTPYDALGNNEMVLLITNSTDSAVVLKDLKIQTPSNTYQPPENIKRIPSDKQSSLQNLNIILLLTITFAAAVIYLKKKKSSKPNAELNAKTKTLPSEKQKLVR
jgi:hypothetical protein